MRERSKHDDDDEEEEDGVKLSQSTLARCKDPSCSRGTCGTEQGSCPVLPVAACQQLLQATESSGAARFQIDARFLVLALPPAAERTRLRVPLTKLPSLTVVSTPINPRILPAFRFPPLGYPRPYK